MTPAALCGKRRLRSTHYELCCNLGILKLPYTKLYCLPNVQCLCVHMIIHVCNRFICTQLAIYKKLYTMYCVVYRNRIWTCDLKRVKSSQGMQSDGSTLLKLPRKVWLSEEISNLPRYPPPPSYFSISRWRDFLHILHKVTYCEFIRNQSNFIFISKIVLL